MSLFIPKHRRARTSTVIDEQSQDSISVRVIRRPPWILIGFSVVVLVSIIGGIIFHPLLAVSYQDRQVIRGVLATTIQASGLLQSPVYNLGFQDVAGKITEIDVTLGQKVHRGQVLARLDDTVLKREVDAAQIAVHSAQHKLEASRFYYGLSLKWIHDNVLVAEAAFDAALANNDVTIQQAKVNIEAAKTVLESDEQLLAVTEHQAEAHIKNGRAQLKLSIVNCMVSFSIVPETPTTSTDNTDPPLAAVTATSTVRMAPPTPSGVIVTVTPSSSERPTTNQSSDKKSSSGASQSQQQQRLKICVHAAQTEYQQTVSDAQLLVAVARAAVKKDQAALKQAYANAKVATAFTQGQVNITRLSIAPAIDSPIRGETTKDVAEDEGLLADALAQLHVARANLVNATLIAPHDGVVTAINGTIGGQPGNPVDIASGAVGSATSGVFIQLVDLSRVDRILLNVDEVDIIKVRIGQSVRFKLKAYGNRQFKGTVKAILPNGVTTSGITFPVIVQINPANIPGVVLFPNMTAEAKIMTK